MLDPDCLVNVHNESAQLAGTFFFAGGEKGGVEGGTLCSLVCISIIGNQTQNPKFLDALILTAWVHREWWAYMQPSDLLWVRVGCNVCCNNPWYP